MEIKRFRAKVRRSIRFVVIVLLAILIGIAASYLIWGKFTLRDYSTRLFWAGIGAVIVGAVSIWASLGSYSTLGTNMFTAAGDAPIATQRINEQRGMNLRRYGFTFRMAAVGIICIVTSAIIEILTR